MAENSSIEWCTHTFNHVEGCSKVSDGCKNCYAETRAKRYALVVWGSLESGGTRRVKAASGWKEPLKWNRQAVAALKEWAEHSHAGSPAPARPRVFCASLADVFEDWQGPMIDNDGDELYRCDHCQTWATLPVFLAAGSKAAKLEDCPDCGQGRRLLTMADVRARLFKLIEATPNLDWLLLTKRPENLRKFWPMERVPGHVSQNEGDGHRFKWFPNVWLGASVENQKAAGRVLELVTMPAAVHFLSCEPLLDEVNLRKIWFPDGSGFLDALTGVLTLKATSTIPGSPDFWVATDQPLFPPLGWIIAGGESGDRSRAMNPAWPRKLRDDCEAANVPFFFKQWGEYEPQFQTNGPLSSTGEASGKHQTTEAAGLTTLHVRRGKKLAGRTLDGRIHDAFPTPRTTA